MKKVAIVPARGGSKGLINKNLCTVGGLTLVERAIQSALKAEVFDDIVLTTDSADISRVGEKYDITVIHRPYELATDGAKSIDVVLHVLDVLGISDGVSVLLQPTSPLRNHKNVRDALTFYKNNKSESVVSVCEAAQHPYKMVIRNGDDLYSCIRDVGDMDTPRQILPRAFAVNGAIYVNRIKTMIQSNSFFGGEVNFFPMSRESSIDIDDEIDLIIAENLLKRMK